MQYLGSTPIFLSGVASAKSSRMYQAQQAVKLIKVRLIATMDYILKLLNNYNKLLNNYNIVYYIHTNILNKTTSL